MLRRRAACWRCSGRRRHLDRHRGGLRRRRRRTVDRPAADRAGNRDEMVIAPRPLRHPRRSRESSTPRSGALLRDLAGSLRRLETDYVDLWQLHAWAGAAGGVPQCGRRGGAIGPGPLRGVVHFVGWQTAQAPPWQHAVAVGPDRQRPGRVFAAGLTRRGGGRAGRRSPRPGCLPVSPLGLGVADRHYRNRVRRAPRATTAHCRLVRAAVPEPRSRGVVEAVARAADGLTSPHLQVALLWCGMRRA